MADPSLAAVLQLGHDTLAMKQYYLAVSTLYIYDYLLTLPDEVKFGWNGRISPVFILYFMNRYIPMCIMIITNFAWHSPLFTQAICNHFAVFQMVTVLIVSLLSQSIMTLRVYAISKKNRFMAGILVCIMLAHFVLCMFIAIDPHNSALPMPFYDVDAFHVCILVPQISVAAWILYIGLAFDGLAFVLTTFYTFSAARNKFNSGLAKIILRDGTLYFFIIFASLLVYITLGLHARIGLKFIQSEPHCLIVPLLINRLTLSLKKEHYGGSRGNWGVHTFGTTFEAPRPPRRQRHAVEDEYGVEQHAMNIIATSGSELCFA